MSKFNQKNRFSEIVTTYYVPLRRFALSLCKNDFDADDLVSETFLKAFINIKKLKDTTKIKQWLFRILNNCFVSSHRIKRKLIDIDLSLHDEKTHFSLFEVLSKSDFAEIENPETKFLSKLSDSEIQNAINNLPEEFRVAISLCDVEGFSYKEISRILKIPIGTVRSRIARARSLLQQKLWQHALDMGIKITKNIKTKQDYTCTCGKEEGAISNSKMLII